MQNMKRYVYLLISIIFVLTGCSKQQVYDEGYHLVNYLGSLYDHGEFYEDQMRLRYIDFTTMNDAFVCPKPNCTHTDAYTCTSYGMNNHPIVVDDNLYFFDPQVEYNNKNELVIKSIVYRADIDGTNRVHYDTFDNITMLSGMTTLVNDGTMYFGGTVLEYDENGNTTGRQTVSFMSYDFIDKELHNYGVVADGYGTNLFPYGEYNGAVYFVVTTRTDKSDVDSTVFKRYQYDLERKEITELEYHQISVVDEGYYVYKNGKDTVVVNPEGVETVFKDFDSTDGHITNDILSWRVSKGDNEVIDLKTMERLTLRLDFEFIGAEIIYYIDSSYIIKGFDKEQYRYVYIKVNESDLFRR